MLSDDVLIAIGNAIINIKPMALNPCIDLIL